MMYAWLAVLVVIQAMLVMTVVLDIVRGNARWRLEKIFLIGFVACWIAAISLYTM